MGDCEWQNKRGTTKTDGDTGPIRCDGAESMSKLVWY